MPLFRIRPVTEQDIPEMRILFKETVLNVNAKDYSETEVADWASCGDSTEHWEELLSRHRFIAALDGQGRIIGLSSMNADGYLHSMFVHKDRQGEGIASQLLTEVEKMAADCGAETITSEVSITARPFFEKRGYRVVREQKAKARQLFLTNFLMEKNIRSKTESENPNK